MVGVGAIENKNAVTSQVARGVTEYAKDISIGASLGGIVPNDLQSLLIKNASVLSTEVPAEARLKAMNILASNKTTFNLNSLASLEEADAMYILASMLQRPGLALEDPPKPETVINNVLLYKQTICDSHPQFKDEMSDARKFILSPDMQRVMIQESCEWNKEVGNAKTVSSNDVPQRFPSAAIKIRLYKYQMDNKLEMTIDGILLKDDRIIVSDVSLGKGDILTAIKCFGQKTYTISFSMPNYGESLLETLDKLSKNSSGMEQNVVNKIIHEIKGDSKIGSEGITEENKRTIAKMIENMNGKNGCDKEQKALLQVYEALKRTAGLSPEAITKLENLAKVLCTDGAPDKVVVGVKYTAKTPGQQKTIDEGMQVLQEIAVGIASIADYAEKDDKTYTDILWESLQGQLNSSVGKEDFRSVTAGIPNGYMMALKYGLFQDYVEKLGGLQNELFGPDGKSGLLGDFDKYQKNVGEINKLGEKLTRINSAVEARGEVLPGESEEFEAIKKEIANKYKSVVDFSKNGGSEINDKLQKYSWYLNYLTNDEIDYEFLVRFKERFPAVVSEKRDVKDPYTQAIRKCSVEELLYKDQGSTASILDRFKNGEEWSTMNVVVGEGSISNNIGLAKQTLASAISSLPMTKEKINLLNVIIGAKSWSGLGKASIIDKVLMLHNQVSGTQANENYGLIWKTFLTMASGNPHKFLIDNFGQDAVRNLNRLNKADIETIRDNVSALQKRMYEAVKNGQEDGSTSKLAEAERSLKFSDPAALDGALNGLDGLIQTLEKDGLSFDLMEEHMPLQIYDKDGIKKDLPGNDPTAVTIKREAEILRKLLSDALVMNEALSKIDNEKAENAKIIKIPDPVTDVIFSKTVQGKQVPMDVVILGDPGPELEPEKQGKPLDISLNSAGSYLWETGKQSLNFKFLMPKYTIPMGFWQTGSLLWKGFRGPEETRHSYLNMGLQQGFSTMASFFFWENDPFYVISSGISEWKKGQYATALADGTISVPFALLAARRLGTLTIEPIKFAMGLSTMTMDQYIASQGMFFGTAIRVPTVIVRTAARVVRKIQGCPTEAQLSKAKAASRTWRYNNLGGAWMEEKIRRAKEWKPVSAASKVASKITSSKALKGLGKFGEISYYKVLNTGYLDDGFNMIKHTAIKMMNNRKIKLNAPLNEIVSRNQLLPEKIMSSLQPGLAKDVNAAVMEEFRSGRFMDIFAAAKANKLDIDLENEVSNEIMIACEKETRTVLEDMCGRILGPQGKLNMLSRLRTQNLQSQLMSAHEAKLKGIIDKTLAKPEWANEFKKVAADAKGKVAQMIRTKISENNGELAELIEARMRVRLNATIRLLDDIRDLSGSKAIVVGGSRMDIVAVYKVTDGVVSGKDLGAVTQELAVSRPQIAQADIKILYEQLRSVNPFELKKIHGELRLQNYSLRHLKAAEVKTRQAAVESALKKKLAATKKLRAKGGMAEPAPVLGRTAEAMPTEAPAPEVTLTDNEIKLAADQAKGLLSQMRKNMPDVVYKLENGRELTRMEESRIIDMLTKVDLKNMKDLLRFLRANGKTFKLGGKAIGALKVFSKVLGPLAILGSVWFDTIQKWDDLASGDIEKESKADVAILKDNTVGMVTGFVSLASGAGGAIVSKISGKTFKAGYAHTSGAVDKAMEKGLQWADKYLQMGEGFQAEFKAMNWLFDEGINWAYGAHLDPQASVKVKK